MTSRDDRARDAGTESRRAPARVALSFGSMMVLGVGILALLAVAAVGTWGIASAIFSPLWSALQQGFTS